MSRPGARGADAQEPGAPRHDGDYATRGAKAEPLGADAQEQGLSGKTVVLRRRG